MAAARRHPCRLAPTEAFWHVTCPIPGECRAVSRHISAGFPRETRDIRPHKGLPRCRHEYFMLVHIAPSTGPIPSRRSGVSRRILVRQPAGDGRDSGGASPWIRCGFWTRDLPMRLVICHAALSMLDCRILPDTAFITCLLYTSPSPRD